MIGTLPTNFSDTVNSYACPTITMTPDAVKAALTKELNYFDKHGTAFLNPPLDLATPGLCARQLYQCFNSLLNLSKRENNEAVNARYAALTAYFQHLQTKGQSIIEPVEQTNGVDIVLLGRAYHNDPGINHGILDQLQQRGYPILTQDALPLHHEATRQLFSYSGDKDHLSISDVWTNSYSENTNQKIWAAKYVARHPNLVAIELSNFNCGHDAPIYSLITKIIEESNTPYFCFKDLDENQPSGAIKIRIETIDYFLERYRSTTTFKLTH